MKSFLLNRQSRAVVQKLYLIPTPSWNITNSKFSNSLLWNARNKSNGGRKATDILHPRAFSTLNGKTQLASDGLSTNTSPSTASASNVVANQYYPQGNIFNATIGPSLQNKHASITRSFGPTSNADAMLICGGTHLARHASFDPQYSRAKNWIRSHAVGPSVVSPLLISGLLTALVEAAIPQSVPVSTGIDIINPLIVGVETKATIVVESVKAGTQRNNQKYAVGGYELKIRCQATLLRDGSEIAKGYHTVWVPDYHST